MLKSMTGYGRGEAVIGTQNATIEVRSVNHRYLDVQLRVPRCLLPLENKIKKKIATFVSRGKVEVAVQMGAAENCEGSLSVNTEMTEHVYSLLKKMKETAAVPGDIDLPMLLEFKDIIFEAKKEELDESVYWGALEPSLEQALSAMGQMQTAEGEEIEKDMKSRMGFVETVISEIEALAPEVLETKKAGLKERVKELCEGVAVDEVRMVQEIAIISDKSDITEEIVRAKSHFKQFNQWLETAEPVGKKLDFLIQEINREVNTIGSKVSDSEIALKVVNIKNEQEKIREQVQNVM